MQISPLLRSLHRSLHPFAFPSCTAKMASAAKTTAVVEHIVLFKVRDTTEAAKTQKMIYNLRSLAKLNVVSHITAAPIRNSTIPGFTHVLHSRYASKDDLAAYAAHPEHQAVLKDDIVPICDDIMAVDWVADIDVDGARTTPGSAVRVKFGKLKAGVLVGEAIEGLGGGERSVVGRQVSFGENFSPARAKGYSVGFLEVFGGVEEMEKADEGEVEIEREKGHAVLDSVMVVDFVVPSPL